MPTKCSVKGCGGANANKSFFTLPAVFKFKHCPLEKAKLSKKRRKLWLAVLGVPDDDSAIKIRVCSDHFLAGRPAALEDSTNIDWVPSLNIPNILPSRKGKVTKVKPEVKVKARMPLTRSMIPKNYSRNYSTRRSEPKKPLNCKVLLDGNLRCTSFNGTNGSGLAIIQKHGKFTSDNVTLRETAINNIVLRVRLVRENLIELRRKNMLIKQKRRNVSNFGRQIKKKSPSFIYGGEAEYNPIHDEDYLRVAADVRQSLREKREMQNARVPITTVRVTSKPSLQSKLQSKLTPSRISLDNTKTLNKVIKKNDKIKVKFFPKTSTPIRRNVKNGTIPNIDNKQLILHREILFLNQYKNLRLQAIQPEEPTYYLKFGPLRSPDEGQLKYPFQKLVMDVKHMKLPGPSWKIKVIIRQGRISAITFTNKKELERSIAFSSSTNIYNIVIENKPVLLLGAPHHLRCSEDLEILLDIVENIDPKNSMLFYK